MALPPARWISARRTTGRSMRSARPPIRAASGASPRSNMRSWTTSRATRTRRAAASTRAWVDGWTNSTGSVVGYLPGPVCRADDHPRRQAVDALRVQQRQVALLLRGRADLRHDRRTGPSAGPTPWRCGIRAIRSGFADKGNNAFTVSSSGTDIWGNGDQFRFVYKPLSGNGSITAKVDSLTAPTPGPRRAS